DPRLRLDAALVAARALQRAGDLEAAEARLRPLIDGAPRVASARKATTPRARDEARGLLGRILIARGRFAEAIEACARAESDSPAVAETRGLGCLYLGRLDEAEAAFVDAERAAAAQPP